MKIDITPDNKQRVPASSEELTISQVAHLTGINAKAIRYYESIGLLPSPSRGANSYRRYSMADVNRLILLRRIRYLGVPLTEAKTLLNEDLNLIEGQTSVQVPPSQQVSTG